MAVASRNPFAILNDDEDDTVSSPAPTSAPNAETSTPPKSTRGRGGPASRGGRYYQRGGGNKTSPRADEPQSPSNDNTGANGAGEGDRSDRPDRGRGRGRGRGGRGRGEGGFRGRPFDRHSQTGKTDSDKKVHQSWGGDTGPSELAAETWGEADAQANASSPAIEADLNDWGAPATDAPVADEWADTPAAPAEANGESKPAAEGAAETSAEVEAAKEARRKAEEEEEKQMTLDEYLAQQKASPLEGIVPKLEGVRLANDGKDKELWKDAIKLNKDEEEAYFSGKARAPPKPRAKKEEKVVLELDFKSPERFNERGGRGRGRGGDRGGRGGRGRGDRGRGEGRGEGRGGGRTSGRPNIDPQDEKDFPTLS